MDKLFLPKDERQTNEGVVSIVDNDFILNYLNEHEQHAKNTFYNNPNLAASFNNFYEAFPFEPPNFHLMGNYMRPMEMINENERFQAAHCKMEEHHQQNLQMNNENIPKERGKSKKKANYKKKPNNKSLPKAPSENSTQVNLLQLKEINDNEELFNYRNNIKNTYINKISNLITNNVEENHFLSKKSSKLKSENEEEDEIEMRQDNFNRRPFKANDRRNDELERLNKKLEKNRESARNSRKRKKIYIEILENKVGELTRQLESVKKNLEFNQEQLTKISSHSKFLNNLIQIKQQIYNKLEKLSAQPANQSENEINLLIDSLRLRLGASGKERVSTINSLFKQITQILLPGYIRFLFGASNDTSDKNEEINEKNLARKSSNVSENSTNFDSCLNSEFLSEEQQRRLFSELGLNDTQKKNFKKFKKKINAEKNKLKNFFEGILTLKKNFQRQTMNIDNAVDELRNSFSPIQLTKFLLFVEKEKKSLNKMKLSKLFTYPENTFNDEDSDSNSSDFSDLHRETEIEIENNNNSSNGNIKDYKKENMEVETNEKNEADQIKEIHPKSRKKVHLNEELISPL